MIGGTNGGHLTSFSLVDILSHGRACAIMNPYYVVFFAPAVEEPLRLVGEIFKAGGLLEEELEGLQGRELGMVVASRRIYKDGAGYERLPSPYPDITEDLGVSIITVFPNVRHAFDLEPEMDLKPEQVVEPVPQRVLDVLAHSEILKQACYVTDASWVEQEDERLRPSTPLTLEKEAAVVAWPPMHDTLTQFADDYDRFVQRLLSRRKT